jgi:hypothetical protein
MKCEALIGTDEAWKMERCVEFTRGRQRARIMFSQAVVKQLMKWETSKRNS